MGTPGADAGGRVAGVAGILTTALGLAAYFVLLDTIPPPPIPPDLIEEVSEWYADNGTKVLISSYLGGLALVAFFWFLGGLRTTLRRAEGGTGTFSAVAFGGGVTLATMALGGTAFRATLAYSAADLGDEAVVRALYDLANIFYGFGGFGAAVLLLATAAGASRTGALPSVLGWAGGLVGLASLVGAAGVFVTDQPLVLGGSYGLAVFMVFLLWVLATSFVLLGGGQAAGSQTATSA